MTKKKKDKEAKEEEVMPTKEADKGSKGDKIPYPHLKASYGMKKASYMMKVDKHMKVLITKRTSNMGELKDFGAVKTWYETYKSVQET